VNYHRCEKCGDCWDGPIPPHICYNASEEAMQRKFEAFIDYLNNRDKDVDELIRDSRVPPYEGKP